MTTTMLDKSQPYKSIKDFNTNRVTIVQNGKSFTEQGLPLIVGLPSSAKYICPQCDFKTSSADRLYEHAEKLHQASDIQTNVLKVYVQNINRGLPSDEGIDWASLTLTRTTAQKHHDELEEKAGKHSNGHQVKPEGYVCTLCPQLPPFDKKSSLGSHRWNEHKLRKGK